MADRDAESTAVVAPTRHRRRPRADRRSSRPPAGRSPDDPLRPRPSDAPRSEGRRSWLASALLASALALAANPYDLFTVEQDWDRRRLLRRSGGAPRKELGEVLGAYSDETARREGGGESESGDELDGPMTDPEIEGLLEFNRMLAEISDGAEAAEVAAVPAAADRDEGDDGPGDAEGEAAGPVDPSPSDADYGALVSASRPLPPHSLSSLLAQADLFASTFAVVLYDPSADEFYAFYSKKHHWASSVEKLMRAVDGATRLIRLKFGDALGGGDELAFGASAGDYPAARITGCVRERSGAASPRERRSAGTDAGDGDRSDGCPAENAPPVLHFGSAFRRRVFPNMISMPMPEPHHLQCYEHFAQNHEPCPHRKRLARVGEHGLFGEGTRFDWSAAAWDGLVPQVVWRGTDFAYLQTLYPEIGRPSLDSHIAPRLDRLSATNLKQQAVDVLVKNKASLVPRWKGVLLTAQAELEAEKEIEKVGRSEIEKKKMKTRMLPWANIKFSHYVSQKGVKTPTKGSADYRMWERMNFPATGESMDLEALAKYRYHIDLGGGGGTSWSGTIQKLALPGLLFHHVTPTKDYIHDYMKPWKHYVPVAPDLRDLKEKFDWAESHPNQARKIAERGTRLARYWASAKGMEEMFKRDIEDPMRAVFDAYVPVSKTEDAGKTWRKVIADTVGEGNMLPILRCTGKGSSPCERMVGKGAFYDQAQIRRMENSVKQHSGR